MITFLGKKLIKTDEWSHLNGNRCCAQLRQRCSLTQPDRVDINCKSNEVEVEVIVKFYSEWTPSIFRVHFNLTGRTAGIRSSKSLPLLPWLVLLHFYTKAVSRMRMEVQRADAGTFTGGRSRPLCAFALILIPFQSSERRLHLPHQWRTCKEKVKWRERKPKQNHFPFLWMFW